jgi:integrase
MKGHITEKSGSWYVVLNTKDPATGKRKARWHHLPGVTTRQEAERERARLVHEHNEGTIIEPTKLTLAQWCETWIKLGCPGSRCVEVGPKAKERYGELLQYVTATLGTRPLQKLARNDVQLAYNDLANKISPRTITNIHTVLKSCLNRAVVDGYLKVNPTTNTVRPQVGTEKVGTTLDPGQIKTLLNEFHKRSPVLYPIIATLALTGMRRGEALALRWSDFDEKAKTLTIARAVEQTNDGLRLKGPKAKRHGRVVPIGDELVALLRAHRESQLRLVAGVPDGAAVDLTLVKLPADSLIFPSAGSDLTKLRSPLAVSNLYRHNTKRIGGVFARTRLHDLRGSFETNLLNVGVSMHSIASRTGHSVKTMMEKYVGVTSTADKIAQAEIEKLTAGTLK